MPHVSICLLNFQNVPATVECLESLRRLDYPSFDVLLCDNCSPDGSYERLFDWLHAHEFAARAGEAFPLPSGAVGGHAFDFVGLNGRTHRLFLMKSERNGGFSYGCNIALRLALARGDAAFFWLLNNDTVVAPDALDALVRRALEDSSIGITGSTLLNFDPPHGLQAAGGATYRRWRGRARPIRDERAYQQALSSPLGAKGIEQQLSYVVGASMMVSRRFLDEIGLLSEDYFLYCEEIDWAARAKGKFKLAYAPASRVFHRLGATTGERSGGRVSVFNMYRSRLLFAAKFDPLALPSVYLWVTYELLKLFVRGQRARLQAAWSGVASVGVADLWRAASRSTSIRPEKQ